MNNEHRSKSFTGLKRKHEAFNSEFSPEEKKHSKCIASEYNEELKSCSVRVAKWDGDECASYVEDHAGSVSKTSLLSTKHNEGFVENDQDSHSCTTEIVTNSYTTVKISRNNSKGVDGEALETGTSKSYSFHSENSLEKPCYSNAEVNLTTSNSSNLLTSVIKDKDIHDDQHVLSKKSSKPVLHKKNDKNSFSNHIKSGKRVSNCSATKNHDSDVSSSSENENEALHNHSDAYYKRKRYFVDSGSNIKSSNNKKKPIEPKKSTDCKFNERQNLETAMNNIKPCSVVLTRIDDTDSSGNGLRNENKDVIKEVSCKETKSRLAFAYTKHNKCIRRRMQKRAAQKYQNSENLVNKETVSCTSSDEEDTDPSRYDASGTESKNHKVGQHSDQNHRNSASNHNRTYFNESLPSTSSFNHFDDIDTNWAENEYIRKKYPEFFEPQQHKSSSERANEFLCQVDAISLSFFKKRFDVNDYIGKGTENNSDEHDTSKINSHDSSEHSLDSEQSSGSEDNDKFLNFVQKIRKAYKSRMQENGGVGSHLESKSVVDTQSGHKSVEDTQSGHKSVEDSQSGHKSVEDSQSGHKSVLDTQSGHKSVLDTQSGHKNVLDTQSGHKNVLDTQSGHKSVLDTQSGHKSVLDTQSGHKSVLDTQSGHKSVLDTQSGHKSVEDTKSGHKSVEDISDNKSGHKSVEDISDNKSCHENVEQVSDNVEDVSDNKSCHANAEDIPDSKSGHKNVEEVGEIPDTISCHKIVWNILEHGKKNCKLHNAVQCGTKERMNEAASRNMPSTSSTDKNPTLSIPPPKVFRSKFGRPYIVDYFNAEKVDKLFVSVRLRIGDPSFETQEEYEQNSDNESISEICNECGRILENPDDSYEKYEQSSLIKPNVVSEASNSPEPSERENNEILSGSLNPATKFSNSHKNRKFLTNEISPQSPCFDKESDKKVLNNSNDGESASSSKSSEDELSDSTIITVNENDNCVHCSYIFLNKDDTYNHTCSGKREKGFLCMYCEKVFASDEEFRAHSKKIHVIST